MLGLGTAWSRNARRVHGRLAALSVHGLATVAALVGIGAERAAAQDTNCRPKHGSAVIICGINGGTSSQVFSPGSVIIMRQDALAFPGDLPNSALPEESAAAREGMAFLSGGFAAGRDITGFVTGYGAALDKSGTDVERGYSSDRRGVIAGLRVERPGYTVFFGLDAANESQDYEAGSFGADSTETGNPLPLPPATADRDEFGISLGASFDLRPGLVWHVAGRVARMDLETRRLSYDLVSTDFPPSPNPLDNRQGTFIGRGSTEGTSIAAQTGLSLGRPLGAGFHGGLSGTLLYVHEEFDGFTERLADGRETFTFGEDDRTSFASRIGVEVARPVRLGGAMVVPSLRVAWLHEFKDDSRTIDVHAPAFLTGSLNEDIDFAIRTNEPDRDYFTVGASLGTVFAKGRGSLAIDYEAIVGHEFIDEHLIGLRFGYRF